MEQSAGERPSALKSPGPEKKARKVDGSGAGVLDEMDNAMGVPPGLPNNLSAAPVLPGSVAGASGQNLPPEVSPGGLNELFAKLSKMHLEMSTEFRSVRSQFETQEADFKTQFETQKADFKRDLGEFQNKMVSKAQFEELE